MILIRELLALSFLKRTWRYTTLNEWILYIIFKDFTTHDIIFFYARENIGLNSLHLYIYNNLHELFMTSLFLGLIAID